MLLDVSEILTNIRNNSITSLDLHKERLAKAKDFQSIAILTGHTAPIYALASLSDGRIVSGSGDKTLCVWDVNTGQKIATLTGHTNFVTALASLSDSRIISGSRDKTLCVWDINTRQRIAILMGHTNIVRAIAILSNGRIISGSWDKTLRLWDTTTYQLMAIFKGHTDSINALAVLHDDRIVSGSNDRTLRLWDADTQQCIAILTGHSGAVLALAILPEGRIVSGSNDRTLRLWDADTQHCTAILTGHNNYVEALAILPDSHIVSGSGDNTTCVWNANTQHCTAILTGDASYINALASLPDGRIVSGSADNSLRVWDGGVPVLSLTDFDKIIFALKTNGSVKSLSFACSNLNISQLQAIADLLKGNCTLTNLDLSYNFIDDVGAKLLIAALKGNKALRSLNLYHNAISYVFENSIDKLLKRNQRAFTKSLQPTPAKLVASVNPAKLMPGPHAALPTPPGLWARALYDYTAAPGELFFKADEVLEVLTQDSSGWWRCRLRGKESLVPSSFVEILSNTPVVNNLLPTSPKSSASKRDIQSASSSSASPSIPPLAQSFEIPLTDIYLDRNDIEKSLARGASSNVYLACWQNSNVVVKEMHGDISKAEEIEHFKREAKILANLRHPNIILLYGVNFEKSLLIVMEYCSKGSLRKLLNQQPGISLSINQQYQMGLDIAQGLACIHRNKIMHLDLKPENILISNEGRLKLADFGISITQTQVENTATGVRGTVIYMAPEMLVFESKEEAFTAKADIYGYGIILWELVSCTRPYHDQVFRSAPQEMIQIYKLVVDEQKRPQPSPNKLAEENKTSPSFAKLISRCWAQRREDRPDAQTIVQDLEATRPAA